MTRPPTPARFSRRYSALPFASMSPMKRARKRDQIGWLTFGPAADPVTGGESLTGTLAIVPLSRIQGPNRMTRPAQPSVREVTESPGLHVEVRLMKRHRPGRRVLRMAASTLSEWARGARHDANRPEPHRCWR